MLCDVSIYLFEFEQLCDNMFDKRLLCVEFCLVDCINMSDVCQTSSHGKWWENKFLNAISFFFFFCFMIQNNNKENIYKSK